MVLNHVSQILMVLFGSTMVIRKNKAANANRCCTYILLNATLWRSQLSNTVKKANAIHRYIRDKLAVASKDPLENILSAILHIRTKKMECPHCYAENTIVTKIRKGTEVCMQCGYVLTMNIIDDRPFLDIHNPDHYTLYDISSCPQEIINASEWLDIPENTTELAGHLFSQVPTTKRTNRMATMARCLWKACEQTNITRPRAELLNAFDITESDFTTTNNNTNIALSTCAANTQDIRRRFACHAQVLVPDEKKRLLILDAASKLESILRSNTHFVNTKPSKMDGVLFYYVATTLQNTAKIAKKQVLQICDISNVTFNKHLNFLKEQTPSS